MSNERAGDAFAQMIILPDNLTVTKERGHYTEARLKTELMAKEKLVIFTIHHFYGTKEAILRNLVENNTSNSELFLRLIGICFPNADESSDNEQIQVTYIICDPLQSPMYSIFDFIAQESNFPSYKLFTICNNIATAMQELEERNSMFIRTPSDVMVSKDLKAFILPALNTIDWNEDNCPIATCHSEQYVTLVATQNFTCPTPHWIAHEDKNSFLKFMNRIFGICEARYEAESSNKKENAKNEILGFKDALSFLEDENASWEDIRRDLVKRLTKLTLAHSGTRKFWIKWLPLDVNEYAQATAQTLASKIFKECKEQYSKESRSYRSVVAVLCDIMGYHHSANPVLDMSNFKRVLEYFGPISAELIENITELLRKKWFHGMLDSKSVEARLKGTQHGTFLVRFSSSRVGNFALSKSSRDKDAKPNQFLITHKYGTGFTFGSRNYGRLEEIIFSKKLDFNLFQPCEGSPFTSLFTKNKLQCSRYEECSDEEFH